jgi:hypothetical protein
MILIGWLAVMVIVVAFWVWVFSDVGGHRAPTKRQRAYNQRLLESTLDTERKRA